MADTQEQPIKWASRLPPPTHGRRSLLAMLPWPSRASGCWASTTPLSSLFSAISRKSPSRRSTRRWPAPHRRPRRPHQPPCARAHGRRRPQPARFVERVASLAAPRTALEDAGRCSHGRDAGRLFRSCGGRSRRLAAAGGARRAHLLLGALHHQAPAAPAASKIRRRFVGFLACVACFLTYVIILHRSHARPHFQPIASCLPCERQIPSRSTHTVAASTLERVSTATT